MARKRSDCCEKNGIQDGDLISINVPVMDGINITVKGTAKVDANGLVTAKTAGTAIITVELAATPYYQGATKNVEISVDAVLSIDATKNGENL